MIIIIIIIINVKQYNLLHFDWYLTLKDSTLYVYVYMFMFVSVVQFIACSLSQSRTQYVESAMCTFMCNVLTMSHMVSCFSIALIILNHEESQVMILLRI